MNKSSRVAPEVNSGNRDVVSSYKMHYALAMYAVAEHPTNCGMPGDYLTQSVLAVCRLHGLIIGKFTNQVKRSPVRNFVTTLRGTSAYQ